jgi:hypothetical protein
MNWIDLLLVLMIASVAALAAKRQLAGAVVALGGLLLFKPLLVLVHAQAVLGLVLVGIAALVLGLLGRLTARAIFVKPWLGRWLGGTAGLALGVVLALATVTSFPVGRDIHGRIVYPAPDLPVLLRSAVPQSQMVQVGRDILLYPLLEAASQVPSGQRVLLRGLHDYLIIGRPWERG